MNEWTQRSAVMAATSNYLDRLFAVYPISSGDPRPLRQSTRTAIQAAIEDDSDEGKKRLIWECISGGEVSPIKDSYIGFIKQDRTCLDRNPNTVNRLWSTLREMGYDEIIEQMERPAESNRQMGQAFKNWIDTGRLGIPVTYDRDLFINSTDNMILNGSDRELGEFARINLGYGQNRGLDFLCRFNNKYIIGEAKFITASGGNQNNQMDKALQIFTSITVTTRYEVIPVAILDGVIYLEGNNRQYATLQRNNNVVLSSLLLRDFVYSLQD